MSPDDALNEFLGIVNLKKHGPQLNTGGSCEGMPSYSNDNLHIWALRKGLLANNFFALVFGRIADVSHEKHRLKDYDKPESLVIALYQEYGEEFIKILDGYFLVILYKEALKKLHIFNNRYLNTRFYYYLDDEKFIFANSLKKILRSLPDKPALNKKTVINYLNNGYSFSEKTFFEKILRLPPGYYLTAHSGQINFYKYSGLVFNRKPIRDLQGKIDEYESLFLSAIEKNIDAYSCKELGCELSGGTDTSWIYLNAARKFRKDMHAYTCYYQQPLFNEVEKAKQVIMRFGGIHHKILIKPEDLDYVPGMVRSAEEPVLSSSLAIYKLIKEASRDVDTLLNGNGGDSFFGSFYPVAELHKYMRYAPTVFRRIFHLIFLILARTANWERFYECEHVARVFTPKNFYKNFYENLVSYRHFNREMRDRLLNPSFFTDPTINECMDALPITRESIFNDLINTKCVYGIMQYQLTWEDKFCLENGLNLISPYFNKRIMDFLCSLPMECLVRGNHLERLTHTAIQRYFQKCALGRYFPEDFVFKQNQPFDQPFHSWFEARPKVVENLFKSLMNRGWFNNSYLEKIYKEHKKQRLHKREYCELKNHGHRIFALLTLEAWCREFLDSNSYNETYEDVPLEYYLERKI